MGGRDALRGYLVQTMASLIEALNDKNDWEAVSLEPVHESEKIDVKWQYSDHIKVVQIKSSINPFSQNQIKIWCSELKNSTKADLYELVLIGNLSHTSTKLDVYEGVNIPHPKPLDLEVMLKTISYDLSVYCEQREIPAIPPSSWRILACSLIFKLEYESIYGQPASRDKFDNLLTQWLFSLLPTIKDINSETDLNLLMEDINKKSYQPSPWIQQLKLHEINDSSMNSLNFIDVLNENSKIILIGNSGTGKTTLLKIASTELNRDSVHLCLWIPLRSFTLTLENTIKKFLGWNDLRDEKVIPTLEKLNVILFLDGLNEVDETERRHCVNDITNLFSSYKGKLCLTYPSSDHAFYGFDYPVYKISKLTNDQIEQTVKTFFAAIGNPDGAIWFRQSVRGWDQEKQSEFDKLAQIPINLQFILELLESENFEYAGLRDLYGQVIQKRLERTKRIDQKGQISVELKTECLKKLAFQSFIDKKPLQLTRPYILSIFKSILSNSEMISAFDEIVRAGLLIEINDFLIEWPHSSFRDYLAGRMLFDFVETSESIDPFPFENNDTIGALAHATRLITTQSQNLENRPKILSALLKRNPSYEALKAVAEEYHTAINYLNSTQQTLSFDLEDFKKMRWGERFLETYQLIKNVAKQNGFTSVDKIPSPAGLVVFFDKESGFCGILYTGNIGINYEKLDNFQDWISKSKKRKKTCTGFCIFAPLFRLLDPEIVAYLQVGLWLRSFPSDSSNRLNLWHNDLTTFIRPNNEWISWSQSLDLPKPEYNLCADPKQTFEFLNKKFGEAQVTQFRETTNIICWSTNQYLSWGEIYMPITFYIKPTKVQSQIEAVSSRSGEIMVLTPPNYNISLILLMPFSQKLDFGINILCHFLYHY